MRKESARAELERGTRWNAVRSGLTVLTVIWTISTLTSAGVQLLAQSFEKAALAGDMAAGIRLGALSNINLFIYSLVALVFLYGSLRLTRASPDSGAVTPALVAAVAYLAVAIVNTAAAVATRGADPTATVSVDATREMWALLVFARAVAILALSLALIRLAAARDRAIHPAHIGALLVVALIDTGYPLGRLIAGSTSSLGAGTRQALLAVQIALAAMIVQLCLRIRAAISPDETRPAQKRKKKKKKKKPAEDGVPEVDDELPPPSLPVPTENAMALAAALAAVAVLLLPVWDAFTEPDLRLRSVAFVVTALVFGYGLFRSMQTAPYGARGLFALMALGAVAYAGVTASQIAVQRSHQIDNWPVCETGLDVRGELIPNVPEQSAGYAGPRLPSGIPCTRAAERRDEHAQKSPEGNLQDGLIQIGIRFAQDRARIFVGTFAIVIALIVSGVVVARSARAVD